MSFNSIGNILRLTTYGESHGASIGGILDGMPAGVKIDIDIIQQQLNRRRPGQSDITTTRDENDRVELLSGIKDGFTTGHSIGFQILNQDKKSSDYEELNSLYRPSHADYTYHHKYGTRHEAGGGRSSARETANWVVAGSIARQLIPEVEVYSYVSQIEHIIMSDENIDVKSIDNNIVRCPDETTANKMIEAIQNAKKDGDSLGGIVSTIVNNVPVGWGEPIFMKLEAQLAHAMMSINATKGFEIGSGFNAATMRGSQHNDAWSDDKTTTTNHSGGVQGGISNGMPIIFKTAFKPTSTIAIAQETIDTSYEKVHLNAKGRHDPCVVPRAVPIVDAMTYLVLADMYLMSKMRRI